MNRLQFEILKFLSGNLGRAYTIREIADGLKAHYSLVFNNTKKLEKEGLLLSETIGKSSSISLNFESDLLITALSELELNEKASLIRDIPRLRRLFTELEIYFGGISEIMSPPRGYYCIDSIAIIEPRRNIKANRAELLFLMREPNATGGFGRIESRKELEKILDEEIKSLYSLKIPLRETMKQELNLRIDYLALKTGEFYNLLGSGERNPLREMLSDKVAIAGPQDFWLAIWRALQRKRLPVSSQAPLSPLKISEKDLAYNLDRLGYREMGTAAGEGEKICPESMIISALLKGDKRRIEAIPVIISKRIGADKPLNYRLLIFLAEKYGKAGQLLGLLEALQGITPNEDLKGAIGLLKGLEIKEEKADSAAIKQKMRIYNAG